MSYQLRPYQSEAVEVAMKHLQSYGKPFVIQAATGAGKSLMIAEICHRLNEPVLILQPSKELLEQNHAKLESYGVEDIAIYSASKGRKEIDKYVFATIGSIYKKPELFKGFKYILVDECDLVDPKKLDGMYRKFFDALGIKAICGLTATPYRILQRTVVEHGAWYQTAMLRAINRIGSKDRGNVVFWGKIAYKIETQELIDAGYLAPIKYREDSHQLHNLVVNSTGADYTEQSLERWEDSQIVRVADYVSWIDKNAKCNLVFMHAVAAAEALQRILEGRGIQAHIVSAKTRPSDRTQAIEDFKMGRVKHMLNVGVFLAGFDVPELNSIVFARPTMSLRIWYQAVGRGVRLDPADPTKVLRVFDLAGALQKMGRVETIKLGVEGNGFKTTVMSEKGRLDSIPIKEYGAQQ